MIVIIIIIIIIIGKIDSNDLNEETKYSLPKSIKSRGKFNNSFFDDNDDDE
jgi:hypothetical protein